MKTNYIKVNQYFSELFRIKKRMLNMDNIFMDLIWLEEYKSIVSNGFNANNLPYLLSLIHPNFYYCNGIFFGSDIKWNRNKDFSSDITYTTPCMIERYIGVNCIFNDDRNIRGKCEADHFWPNYLGGPSIKENRLILCSFHNGMKGSDISNYKWDEVPIWLESYLNNIRNLKQS